METDLFTVHNRALSWFGSLTPEERAALDALIAPLVNLPEEAWESRGGTRLSLREPVFRFNLDADDIRVFVRPNPGGKPEVVDFAHQETIDWLRALDRGPESAAPQEVGARA
jgi:hypothetical protein